MIPQYLAVGPYEVNLTATLWPQHIKLGPYPYLFLDDLCIHLPCRVRAAVRQAGLNDPVLKKNKNWRNRCQRASKHCWRLAWLQLLQAALILRRLKNMSWSIPSRFPGSLRTPGNTSKLFGKCFGQAFRPVPLSVPHFLEGAL